MLDVLESALNILGTSWLRIDGSTAPGARQPLLDTFESDTSIRVMLLSTRAGGVGLNIASANTVIIYDCDWNPLMDVQV